MIWRQKFSLMPVYGKSDTRCDKLTSNLAPTLLGKDDELLSCQTVRLDR
uniref:Uncharacterized protein n=1 Tax=Rhizophora mucronata TaxID=61149 RepID=A0A2P2NUK2_RHIMU